jgi:hypothetical protein
MPKVNSGTANKNDKDLHHEDPGLPQDIEPVDIEKLKFD